MWAAPYRAWMGSMASGMITAGFFIRSCRVAVGVSMLLSSWRGERLCHTGVVSTVYLKDFCGLG